MSTTDNTTIIIIIIIIIIRCPILNCDNKDSLSLCSAEFAFTSDPMQPKTWDSRRTGV